MTDFDHAETAEAFDESRPRYADQNDADYVAFSRAAEDDRIAVQRGV